VPQSRQLSLIVAAGVLLAALAGARPTVAADAAPFDLSGPSLTVGVERNAVRLPIDEVPNLREGDALHVRAVLPPSQSAHYLMVLVFLRGATNPPPKDWFHACETWKEPCASKGVDVAVPAGAQQVLVLFAPETRGDLHTLVDAVTGRPGAFVRASQALNQAALDRSRLDAYLAALGDLDRTQRSHLKESAPLLARSLALKLDDRCLDRSPEFQAPCLLQGQETVVLSDGHSKSLVDTLTSGPSADLAMVATGTRELGGGALGPYVASLLDLGRVLSSLRTAHYLYLPALALPAGEHVQLSLNSPPSFHEPYSVLVGSLPAVAPPQWPPLRAVDPHAQYCARRPELVLPVDGAPLVFSTHYAHDMQLQVGSGERALRLPAKADVERGGYVIDLHAVPAEALDERMPARLVGRWGFEAYNGPSFSLEGKPGTWSLVDAADAQLVAGRENAVHIKGTAASCLAEISARDASDMPVPVQWKDLGDGELEATLDLAGSMPGAVTLQVSQVGMPAPTTLELHAYPDLVRIDSLALSPGDGMAVMRGNRLDQVAGVRLEHVDYAVHQLLQVHGKDELLLAAEEGTRDGATPSPRAKAKVKLVEGRSQQVAFTLAGARPVAALVQRNVARQERQGALALKLSGNEDVAPDDSLAFSVRLEGAQSFTADGGIDVATADHHYVGQLQPGSGMQLASPQVAIATFSPARLLGPLATGALQFRVNTGGLPGEWQPLAHVVRVPELLSFECPPDAAAGPCTLRGRNLFLVGQVRSGRGAAGAAQVPEGYTGETITVARPANGRLSFVLRDDPDSVHALELPPPAAVPAPEPAPVVASPAPAVPAPTAPAVAATPPGSASP
jgi:hypothetical protein